MTTLSLGQTLRAWRQRVSPADVGLASGRGLRRTPGLRREELAWLAGVSPDYVQRLEQDRAHPSRDIVTALARALRVSRDESDLLARLAGHAASTQEQVSQHITPGVQRLTDRLADVPLAIYDASWTLLTNNQAWAAIFGDLHGAAGSERNVVWQHFTGSTKRITHQDHDGHERALIADLQRAAAQYPLDHDLASMITALTGGNERFAQLWAQPGATRHAGQHKTVHGTRAGDITLDCDVLTVPDADLRIVVFTAAASSEDAEKLDLLRVIGLQEFAPDDRV